MPVGQLRKTIEFPLWISLICGFPLKLFIVYVSVWVKEGQCQCGFSIFSYRISFFWYVVWKKIKFGSKFLLKCAICRFNFIIIKNACVNLWDFIILQAAPSLSSSYLNSWRFSLSHTLIYIIQMWDFFSIHIKKFSQYNKILFISTKFHYKNHLVSVYWSQYVLLNSTLLFDSTNVYYELWTWL